MPRPNVFFFTGENEYLHHGELRRWREGFREKHGEENLLSVTGKEQTLTSLLDAVSVMPFIAEKRLVICEGIPKIEKEDALVLLDSVHPQTVFIISEAKPDKRLGIVKVLEKEMAIKSFPPFTPKELDAWLAGFLKEEKISCDKHACDTLRELVGDDPMMLASELKKLSIFCGENGITEQAVRMLALPSGERVIWGMTNLLGQKKIPEALQFFRDQVERGENPYSLWTVLLDMARKLIAIWAALQNGVHAGQIAKDLKLHPMAVRGMMPLAQSLTEEDIRALSVFMTESDRALKTGGFRYTAESPEEVIALAERAMLACL